MIEVTVNGEAKRFADALTLDKMLREMGLAPEKIAVERNREIVPRSQYTDVHLGSGDQLEIVHFIGGGDAGGAPENDPFVIDGNSYRSRLIVGTGKYKDFEETKLAIEASGAEIVTVAVRRVNVSNPNEPMLVDYVDPKNTLTCRIRRDVLQPRTLCARYGWHAKRVAGIWSNLKFWGIRRRSIRVCRKPFRRLRNW